MEPRLLDLTGDPRRAHFDYFRTMANPYLSVTANCDITPLREKTLREGLPFFLPLLYCAANAANDVPELRRRIRGDTAVEYSQCDSSHTVALPDGSYCYCRLNCRQPFARFLPYAQAEVERAKAVKAGLKSDCLVLYNVFAPFSSIRFGTSDELVMRHLREDPKAIEYALDVIAQDNALLCEKLITEAGIDGVYYCVQGGEKNRFTPDEYRRYITPSDLKVLEHANRFSGYNVLHCCGWAGIPNNLEVWRDYPAAAINWACFIENMGLCEGKEFFGGKCVLGGFDNRATGLMYNGTREEIQEFTRELVQRSGSTGVMLGADCTLPATVDVNHIQWVVDAVSAL